MSGSKLFVDTNICIYLLNSDLVVAELLDGYQIYISFITEIELYAYHHANQSAKAILDSFVNSVNVVNIDEAIKLKTIDVRRDHKRKLPDSIIAASAIIENMTFITSDKGFQKIAGLDIILYDPISN